MDIQSAIRYLHNHFNSNLGLIYESEDLGKKTYDGKEYDHQHIYYLYSDNLLAMYALSPYDINLSNTISESLSKYILKHYLISSKFFEALFGYTLPSQMLDGEDKIIEKIDDKIILAEIHNKQPSLNWEIYGNTLILKALSELWDGNEEVAISNFEKALSMWDGKGIYDDATHIDGKYANYKIAILLYASKILGYNLPNWIDFEKTLWFMQNPDGGIASLSLGDGKPLGSANCETTSLTLLIYNDDLIQRLRQQIGKATKISKPSEKLTPQKEESTRKITLKKIEKTSRLRTRKKQ